jgi:hypothetical protein
MKRRSIPVSEIKPRAYQYVWRDRIAARVISAIGGHPNSGKSLMSYHMAADVSRHGHVLISNHDEEQEESLRPRIAAAGADMAKVHVFNPIPSLDRFPRDSISCAKRSRTTKRN